MSDEISIDFLKQIAIKVYDNVYPLLGTKEGARKTKRGAGGDISMQIDLIAENVIIDTLKKKNAHLLFISEEVGEKYIGDKEVAIRNQNKLIVDPIDGSNNAARGIPYSCVSIAYAAGKKIRDINKAVVLDLTTKDLYWAIKGEGAYLNDKKISVSDMDISQKCVFEINLAMRNLIKNLTKYKSILDKIYRIRVLGSTALSMCQIARGTMDAFLNLRKSNRLVDAAAGILIVREAGGKFFSIEGMEIDEELSIDLRFPFIVSNAKLETFLKEKLVEINS